MAQGKRLCRQDPRAPFLGEEGLARLALAFAFNGACGLGGVFSIRRRTSSSRNVPSDSAMSQPPPINLPPLTGPSPQECDAILGTYIRRWGEVEFSLERLIWKLLETDPISAQIVFRALGDVRSQRELAIELGHHRLYKADFEALDGFMSRLKAAATKRNRIVHGRWMLHIEMGPPPNPHPLTAKSQRWMRIYDPAQRDEFEKLHAGKSQKLNSAYRFWPDDILAEEVKARDLSSEIGLFLDRMSLRPPRIPLPVEW